MFNIGTPELLVILIVALIVVGPRRLPEIGRTVGRALNELRKVQDEVRDMVKFDLSEDGPTQLPETKPIPTPHRPHALDGPGAEPVDTPTEKVDGPDGEALEAPIETVELPDIAASPDDRDAALDGGLDDTPSATTE